MITITGINGVVGRPLYEVLKQNNVPLVAVSRAKNHLDDFVNWDLSEPIPSRTLSLVANSEWFIHCAPIWLLSEHMDQLVRHSINNFIVFSSSSVIGKSESEESSDKALVSLLSEAEQKIRSIATENNINLVILRPSMIYGYGRDQNIMRLAQFINRFGFVMLAGNANGRRQPIHSADLVKLCLVIMDSKSTGIHAFQVAGLEVFTYRQMVERVFLALNRRVRIISIPVSFYRLLLRTAALVSDFEYTPSMANRMEQDLVYDNAPVQKQYGFQPGLFLSNPVEDLAGLKK